MQDLERGRRVRERYHQGARLGQPGGDQRFAPPCIAVDDAAAVRGSFAYTLGIGVERDARNLLFLEESREVLAAAAEATDDHVLLPGHRAGGDLCHLRGARQPVVCCQPSRQGCGDLDQERRSQHR